MKPKVPDLPGFQSGGARVDVADRDTLYEVVSGGPRGWRPDSLLLNVEEEGRIALPENVRAALGLGPGDLLSIQRNAISLRFDLYRELLEPLRGAAVEPGDWRCLEQFLRRPLVAVRRDGSLDVPSELMSLRPGRLFVLEVVREGLGHALYLYPDREG